MGLKMEIYFLHCTTAEMHKKISHGLRDCERRRKNGWGLVLRRGSLGSLPKATVLFPHRFESANHLRVQHIRHGMPYDENTHYYVKKGRLRYIHVMFTEYRLQP